VFLWGWLIHSALSDIRRELKQIKSKRPSKPDDDRYDLGEDNGTHLAENTTEPKIKSASCLKVFEVKAAPPMLCRRESTNANVY
jgi:hypothetical protein